MKTIIETLNPISIADREMANQSLKRDWQTRGFFFGRGCRGPNLFIVDKGGRAKEKMRSAPFVPLVVIFFGRKLVSKLGFLLFFPDFKSCFLSATPITETLLSSCSDLL